ncbi:hypothetical protein FACS189475_09780 [Betaproteobacteria bacterium]|nr:hypothetical protein FACS189475_09780 [Betaproteobacteria bacterium]
MAAAQLRPHGVRGVATGLCSSVARISEQDGILAVPAQSAPDPDNALGHILFALKHEGVNLQILSRALPRVTAGELHDAVQANPNGRYLRVAAFLWEHFTRQELPDPPVQTSAYVDVLAGLVRHH